MYNYVLNMFKQLVITNNHHLTINYPLHVDYKLHYYDALESI